jgi:hypothetical protein
MKRVETYLPPMTGSDKANHLVGGNQRKGKIGPTLYFVNIEIGLTSFSLA